MKILTQNLLSKDGGSEQPELNYVNRKEDLFTLIKEIDPDIICFQEVTTGWKKLLNDERFSEYRFVGEGRDGNGKGEHNPVCWKNGKYSLISERTFWLSHTPEKVSKPLLARMNRICTYAYLRDNESGCEFAIACTHLDHRSEFGRRKNADYLLKNLEPIYTKSPFILCGDFNCKIDGYAYKKVSKALHDSFVIATDAVPYVTYHEFGKYEGDLSPIDYIFVNDSFAVDRYRVLNSKGKSGNYISDHYGVLADVRLKQDG